ncbi:MAG: hypothetical protein DRN29_02265 [Thermoplasmata archaeon]|nr:MAG: hypothetical protein DRN29_02265 [Thermoplasmata archaeon]
MTAFGGWAIVELYYAIKRFGRTWIGKIVNTVISFLIFLLAISIALSGNAAFALFSIPFFIMSFFLFIKTVILI